MEKAKASSPAPFCKALSSTTLYQNKMKTLFRPLAIALLAGTCLFTACNKDDEEENQEPAALVDPTDANALSAVLIMPTGSQSRTGAPPAPTNSSSAPAVFNNSSTVLSSNGSTAPLNFEYSNVSGNLAGCYVQIDGAGNYYTVPYSATSNNSGTLQLPLGIPTNVEEGEFCVNFCVYDTNGLVSNVVSTCVSVLRLGTGSVQISLSWDNESDQDLYVTDPTGTEISYINTISQSGGALDRDDTDGFGPENIYWTEEAPDGTYVVKVNDYDDTITPTTFYVTVSGLNSSRSFTGTTVNGSTADVVTFRKSGSSLQF